jgi:hypothetical protein
MAEEKKKCAHKPCSCNVPTGQSFCSDYCKHAATSGPPREETVCRCGHHSCGGNH